MIPIQNVYYLLCYAWNKLDEKDRVKINVEDQLSLLDLLAKVLVNATQRLLKRGIDKSYIDHTQELAGVKGKIQISETLKRHLLRHQKTVCNFDEFSANILPNQILATTIQKLINTNELAKDLKNELISVYRMFAGISQIKITQGLFNQVKLHRNNRLYGFVMHVCGIIHENMLPTEQPGKYSFADFMRDEKKMNRLFEAFIRNFYKIEQKKYSIVKKETIKWNLETADLESRAYLPQMETDITLENDDAKIIIDAKYYRETMAVNYNNKKIKSENLYQLFSYLLNQEGASEKGTRATGILLYPTIDDDYNLLYKYKEHAVHIRTVNLNTNWQNIANRLLEVIGQ